MSMELEQSKPTPIQRNNDKVILARNETESDANDGGRKHMEALKQINVSSEHKLNKIMRGYQNSNEDDEVEMGDIVEIDRI